ncbi:hypothetical protein [Streptomyces spectabilis]|uniref:Uncharacterized protein n=1 Tax=Streptomyces spectabilis TaxID=68270 RepID=A0A5P2XCZ1_STRST|nr:hypothetical protein [Streptomyces spectabilis]MBB5103707.1 hypothetical protein [Streptomyces spectabilis]MCI3904051.1 hypothetical protein [Streptomyces spectabilis]QEV61189.1 hypothetical protein CP982_22830 [Streptomyces spectabilis]GGV19269.1 hypothetical protein GCM10010245_32590 [Streptomyces spectabilis]
MTDFDDYTGRQEPMGPYEAYRNHLDTCPHRHFGILADCSEGARLHAAWIEGDRRATTPTGPARGGQGA